MFVFVKKTDHMYGFFFFFKLGQHREERRDEMTVHRRGDKIKKKKLIVDPSTVKKVE